MTKANKSSYLDEPTQWQGSVPREPIKSHLNLLDPWLVGALVTTIVIRLINLDSAALWFDETFTAQWIVLPWSEMVHTLFFGDYGANHLPFYFLILKAWSALAGVSPWALRLLSALFSIAAIPVIAALAHTLIGRNAARWAAWYAALSPYLLHHAQEARMYPLLALLAASSLLLLARFLTGASRKLGIAFVVSNAALLATHYYAVFLIGAELLVLLILRPWAWRSWISAAACTALLTLAPIFTALLVATHHAGESYAMGLLALPGLVWSMLSGYTLIPSSAELHAVGVRAVLPYLPIASLAAIAFCIAVISALRTISHDARILILVILGVVLLSTFGISLFLDIGLNPRYSIVGAPVFLVMLAAGAPHNPKERSRAAASIIIGLTMIIASALHLADPGHGREDIYAAGKWLDANVPVDEEILMTSVEMAHLAQFHWPNRKFIIYPPPKVMATEGNAEALAQTFPFYNPSRVIYIIGRAWLSDPDGVLQKRLVNRYSHCPGTEVRGIKILCLIHPPS